MAYGSVMTVYGEPGYADQVPRRQAYQAAHPEVEILYLGPCWQAIICEESGKTIITRYELKALLDTLEALDREAADGPARLSGPTCQTARRADAANRDHLLTVANSPGRAAQ